MSRTMRRNGSIVENAAREVSKYHADFTVGEVAAMAHCSKPTARKYLDMMVGAGVLVVWTHRLSTTRFYSFDKIPF